MPYIKLEDLQKFPIRRDHCDKEHGNEHFIYGVETVLEYAEYLPTYEAEPDIAVPLDDDFCTILICAVRYSIGRQTYMPSLVIDYITPKLHLLNDKCLAVMERDIAEAGYYGHEVIDKPGWMKFLSNVRTEIAHRKVVAEMKNKE